MQEIDDKKLSDLSKRFLQAISYCGLSGYKLKKDNIISSESTLTSIKKGIQLPSKKTIDAFCEKYDVSRAWLYTGEGLFAKTPSGQIEPSEKDIRDALKNARMQSDSTISKVAPYLQDILVKVKYVPIDAAASFVESLYNTAYEIDSMVSCRKKVKCLMILIWSFKYVVTAWSQLYRTELKFLLAK